MKKICTLVLMVIIAISSFAAFTPTHPVPKASSILIPLGKTGNSISLYDLAHISVKDFEKVSGQHLNLTERIGFKLAQRDLRSNIAPDGTVEGKQLNKKLAKIAGKEYGFHAGGFFLGFLLGGIGVLFALIVNNEARKNRVKWALIGWLSFAVIYVAVVLATL